MGRALAAIALLVGVLAAGAIAFLNGGAPQPIYVTPNRTVALPLGQALALAFASGAALIAVIALGTAIGRASRRWQRRRRAAREQAAVTRERVHAERLLVDGDADAARSRLADAVADHLSGLGVKPLVVEGREHGQWVLVDFGDVVVHVFYVPVRGFYDLERLWAKAPRAELPEPFLTQARSLKTGTEHA